MTLVIIFSYVYVHIHISTIMPPYNSGTHRNKTSTLRLTISPSRTTFSPLTINIPLGMSPNFFPTWMRSTV